MASGRPGTLLSERDYHRFRALVRERGGLDLPEARRPELDRAVTAALHACDAQSPTELYARLRSHEEARPALEALLAALAVGETHFFRSRAHFDVLAQRVLPALIDRRRATRRLRIWSAGCATGEEPYSIAILLERLLPDIDAWDVLILATDIARDALERARRGRYRPWSLREVPPEVEAAYFVAREQERELVPRVRDRVRFAYLNLVDERYPSVLSGTVDMDLVLCRNVLIYFDDEITRAVVTRLGQSLAEGGWLLVGHAEAARPAFATLTARRFDGTIIYQRQGG